MKTFLNILGKKLIQLSLALATAFVLVGSVDAATFSAPIDITDLNRIVWQEEVDQTKLSGRVDMALNSGVLTIWLSNTSDAGAAEYGTDGKIIQPAVVLLTGLGFRLPTGVSVDDDSYPLTQVVTPSLLSDKGFTEDDLWGYRFRATGIDESVSGHVGGYSSVKGYAVNTVVTTMTADADRTFSGYEPAGKPLDGPPYGLLSNSESASAVNGTPFIQDTIEIDLFLNTTGYSGSDQDLLDAIAAGDLVITFGSPDNPSIPDGGLTVALMGFSVALLGFMRRRLS